MRRISSSWSWLSAAILALSVFAGWPGSAAADEVVIKDSRGQDIKLNRPVGSVAIFPLPIPEAMIAIDGGTSRLTAINPRAQSALMKGVIGQLFPEIATIRTDLVAPNFIPNVEEILKAGPDIVVQWQAKGDERVAPMENAGIKVATVSTESRETRRGYVTMLGEILGKPDRAQAFLDWDDKTVADISAVLSAAGRKKPRIAFIDSMNDNEFVVFGREEAYFTASGLVNAATEAGFTDGSVKVGAESLLQWNPDIILVNYYNDTIKPADILQHPVLASLDAVKKGRVYKTPAIDPATAAGGELAYQWLAEIGYPDLFKTDMRKAVSDGFKLLYGKELTAGQIDQLLQMDWNGKSAGYAETFGK
ncbi:MAG: ABC transporter substrate-binding protein [Mesorhizobium sp.]|uniref:ABC transporter substrate-binding protein n=1 Tax=Mesorhizobium sp. TaxID=1871066 RepID=UPI001AD164A7|nr:ABC transporter substrate-binding protein [Mesorhizobium sp.]MBN9219463.1 ABC transporter substrate-binding protein [Mesorhizobium sp.]